MYKSSPYALISVNHAKVVLTIGWQAPGAKMVGFTANENVSADVVLDIFQEIILSGLTVSAAFSGPLRPKDTVGLVPFALRTINAAGRRGLSQADLARGLNRSAPWTTRLVDHLERDGLVNRTPHPSDRRVNMLTLTHSGAEALEDFIEKGRAAVTQLFPAQTTFLIGQLRSQLHQISTTISPDGHNDME